MTMRVVENPSVPSNRGGVQLKQTMSEVHSRGVVVYVLAPAWRKRRALCSCGWRGRRHLLQAWAVTDAHLHAARLGCQPAVPLVRPAVLAYSRPQWRSDPAATLTFTSEPPADRHQIAIHPLTGRNCVVMNPNAQAPDRPNAPAPGNSLWAVWRRLRLVLRRDPVASVTSPAAAVRLADETLALIAVAGGAAALPATGSAPVSIVATAVRGLPRRPPPFGAHVWTGLAVEPLAALLCAAAPIGEGHGIEWVAETVVRLDSAEPDDPIWDYILESTTRGTRHLRDALAHLRGLEPRQRRSVTHAMAAAAGRLQR